MFSYDRIHFSTGCDPTIMGIGPVPASKATLKAAGMELKDMDICEVGFHGSIKLMYKHE